MGSFFLAMAAIPLLVSYSFAGSGTLTVSGTQLGVTSQYLGANEGSSQFNINDLVDLGINTYRLYGGMSRWEPTNDSSTYGSPSIAQIEANPAVINWAFWDNIMTNPPGGSDYSWSASTGIPPVSAATIIGDLNAHNITPIIVLRNKDNNGNPSWSPNPPVTTNDWNEWWEHVFATVYWFNVRNNFVVDNWEVHNEPNNSGQGWAGTESQYMTFIQYTADAIHWVYSHYLPGYYAMRIAARALVGARPTYQVTSSVKNVVSVVTKDPSGHYYLIACNSGSPAVTMTANLSALITSGTGTQWEFSSTNNDAIIGSPTLSSGTVTFTIPANATELLKF